MLPLTLHIFYGLVNHRLTDRKRGIFSLPCELPVSVIYGLYPSAAVALCLLNQVCHILVPRQHAKDMNMVADTADTNNLTAGSIDQLADIAMQTVQMFVGYLRAGGLHVEDDMQIYFTKRLCHNCDVFAVGVPGVLPWAISFCPFRAMIVCRSVTQGDALGC